MLLSHCAGYTLHHRLDATANHFLNVLHTCVWSYPIYTVTGVAIIRIFTNKITSGPFPKLFCTDFRQYRSKTTNTRKCDNILRYKASYTVTAPQRDNYGSQPLVYDICTVQLTFLYLTYSSFSASPVLLFSLFSLHDRPRFVSFCN